jgi:TonB family protein
MNGWQYLLLVNIYLLLFYGFYTLLLRRETFFQLNRIYLVCAAALSFIIPLIQAGWVQNLFITREVTYRIYGNPISISSFRPLPAEQISIGQILTFVYFTGVLFLIVRLVWQLISLNKIIKTNREDSAYSFFKKIKLPKDGLDNTVISAHEEIHARQWHSADVFIIEVVMIINWFNPVVYFYRRAIKHIHEFIADDHALKVAANKADYAMLLLNQTFNAPAHSLVNNFFNHSLLKQRIMMLQKNKSQRIKLLKYGLSAPLFILMLILSSATVNNSKIVKAINHHAEQVVLMPVNGKAIHNPVVLPDGHHSYVATVTVTAAAKPAILKKQPVLQLDTTPKKALTIYASVDKEPEFPGGPAVFMTFLARNIRYPAAMREANVQGRVIVTFVVEEDGSLSDVHALRGPGYGANEEAVRVVSTSPNWTPGYKDGKAVRVQYTVPLMFSLESSNGAVVKADTVKKPIDIVLVPPGKTDPLYIIDGKEMKQADFKTLNPNDINSIYILKDKAAIAQYGEKGKNGVILIFTKSYTGPLPPSTKTNK